MRGLIISLFIAILGICSVNCTVRDVLNAAGCNTGLVGGLATQLVTMMNQIKPGLITNLNGLTRISLGSSAAAVPYAQKSTITSLNKAVSARPNATLTINSALRTLPQQVLLYLWYQQKKCSLTLTSKPGSSPHESGYGIDITDYDGWKSYMEISGCQWQGPTDAVHFNCPGQSLGTTSVLAFQKLWNCNNPNDKIVEDGIYGQETESAVLQSPQSGFPSIC